MDRSGTGAPAQPHCRLGAGSWQSCPGFGMPATHPKLSSFPRCLGLLGMTSGFSWLPRKSSFWETGSSLWGLPSLQEDDSNLLEHTVFGVGSGPGRDVLAAGAGEMNQLALQELPASPPQIGHLLPSLSLCSPFTYSVTLINS